MKKRFFASFVALVMTFSTAFFVSAENHRLSTGLSVIVSSSQVKKCTVVNEKLTFSAGDFEKVTGNGGYLTILSLPDKGMGRLVFCGNEVKKGLTISRKGISGLVFEPNTDVTGSASFAFCATPESAKHAICTVYVLPSKNTAPVGKELAFDTLKNISYKGFFEAHDPDGDGIKFIVSAPPKHGTLMLLDEKSGNFMYTPKVDFTGRDTFKFKVCDGYGNMSQAVRAVVHVNEKPTDTVFSDMTNHWAHESAISAFDDKVISAGYDGKNLVFSPEEKVTRGDFLAVSMIAAGFEKDVKRCFFTSFCDDENIPLNIKSYAEAALDLGIVNGYPSDGIPRFESTKYITRKEAAAILSRIVAIKSKNSVRECGENSFDLVEECGIMVGAGGGNMLPDEIVTKAQLARIYCNLVEFCGGGF